METRQLTFYQQEVNLAIEKTKAPRDEIIRLSIPQLDGLIYGIDLYTVKKLTENQINGIIKFGLSTDDVKDLNWQQMRAYLNLHDKGVTPALLREYKNMSSGSHLAALGYAIKFIDSNATTAFLHISQLTELHANALCYGLLPSELESLEVYAIKILVNRQQMAGFQNANSLYKLNEIQINLVKEFYFWGVTSDIVRQYAWITNVEQFKAISYLMRGIFKTFEEAAAEIVNLNQEQLYGINTYGLLRKDVEDLNWFQINAVNRCATAKNGLNASTFKGKTWFNSEEHTNALSYLLTIKQLSLELAFTELDGLTHQQAKELNSEKSRADIPILNHTVLFANSLAADRNVSNISTTSALIKRPNHL